jgi:putative methionine-R-sulfoxide reductase with GAF domain
VVKVYINKIDQTISCLSGSKGEILVGTTGGDVIAFSDDDLTQISRFANVRAIRIVIVAIKVLPTMHITTP